MSAALKRPVSLSAFLSWEERQELRYEFDGVRAVAMTGGTRAHEIIDQRVRETLNARLRAGPCLALGPTLKIQVADRIRYPDAFVVRAPDDPRSTVVHDPVVVFEALSESTARNDMVVKLAEYAAAPSIRRTVIMRQDFIGGLNLIRDGSHFVAEPLDHDSTLRMPELGIEVPVAAFYEGLEYPRVDDDSQSVRRQPVFLIASTGIAKPLFTTAGFLGFPALQCGRHVENPLSQTLASPYRRDPVRNPG